MPYPSLCRALGVFETINSVDKPNPRISTRVDRIIYHPGDFGPFISARVDQINHHPRDLCPFSISMFNLWNLVMLMEFDRTQARTPPFIEKARSLQRSREVEDRRKQHVRDIIAKARSKAENREKAMSKRSLTKIKRGRAPSIGARMSLR